MGHLNSYESFKSKKSVERKSRIKSKKNKVLDDFIVYKHDKYAVVIGVSYNYADVLDDEKVIKARLRKDINYPCNKILFPGDKVVLDDGIIKKLIKRSSLLSRVKKDGTRINDRGDVKNFAANVDIAVIVASAYEPPLHPKFIDRYLMVLENSNIPSIICINKCDLMTNKEKEIIDVYRSLDILVVKTSTYTGEGIDDLKKHLKGRQAIFVGNSGVGKSSLINKLMDFDEIKTGNVSLSSKRGRHTTTTSKYYVWDVNSSIIDTPGIRSLDVSSFKPEKIQNYFKEFDKNMCKYKDCMHYKEPVRSCVIKQRVLKGLINKERYKSYLRIMDDLFNENKCDDILKEKMNG